MTTDAFTSALKRYREARDKKMLKARQEFSKLKGAILQDWARENHRFEVGDILLIDNHNFPQAIKVEEITAELWDNQRPVCVYRGQSYHPKTLRPYSWRHIGAMADTEFFNIQKVEPKRRKRL